MWEHSFYVDYENRKSEYLKNIWKIVNWQKAAGRLDEQFFPSSLDLDMYLGHNSDAFLDRVPIKKP